MITKWIPALLLFSIVSGSAHAEDRDAARHARALKIGGIVTLSVAGTAALVAIGLGAYCPTYAKMPGPGYGDGCAQIAFPAIGLGVSAGVLGAIGTPLAIIGSEREKRARRSQVWLAPTTLSATF